MPDGAVLAATRNLGLAIACDVIGRRGATTVGSVSG